MNIRTLTKMLRIPTPSCMERRSRCLLQCKTPDSNRLTDASCALVLKAIGDLRAPLNPRLETVKGAM